MYINKHNIGFNELEQIVTNSKEANEHISRSFSPEFRNRLDAIIEFAPLSESIISQIVDKYLTILIPTIDELNKLQYRVREIDDKKLYKCEISYYDTQQVFYDAEDKSIIANDYGVREVRRRNIDDDDDEEEEYNIGD